MSDISTSWVYKLIDFFRRWLLRLSRRFNQAALELNFLQYKMRFGERDSDIYIISYPKSGTTMLQMILYQLTTDGDMSFGHIDEVAPWIKNEAFENRKPLDLPSPRIIKSHDPYDSFDHTKGRFIFIMRDGRDVAVSKYHQDKNYNNPGLTFDDFMKGFFKEGKHNWFSFHRDWIENKKARNILYLSYEEVKENKAEVIRRIATFCKLNISEEQFSRAIERSQFDFMKRYEEKFGLREPEKPKIYDQFIRKGKSGSWQEYFNEDHRQQFERQFDVHLAPLMQMD